jgi:hypothetical protein
MLFKRSNKVIKNKYSFVFSLSYTTAKGITIESPKVHITVEDYTEELAKKKALKNINKKVVINFANIV